MADRLYMTGARGGAGCTTCAVNLGIALSDDGERTLIVDGDAACANVLELCGLQNLSVYTLADAEKGACRIKQVILQHPKHGNLFILPTLDCNNQEFIRSAVEESANLFDRVICDNTAIGACRRAIVVTEPYPFRLSGARLATSALTDGGFKDVGIIVNKVNGGLVYDGAILTPQEIASFARVPLIGVIPEDLTLPLGKIRNDTKKAFALTAKVIEGKSDKVHKVMKSYAGPAGYFKRRMRAKI